MFVYFDLGNVLLFFSHERAARQMAEVAGVPYELVWELLWDHELELRYEAGQITSDQFYQEFCEQTGTRPDRQKLLFASGAIFEVNVPMKAVASAVQSAGYRTGILSNTCEAHWDYCIDGRYGGLPDAFDVLVLSYELRAMKPAAEVYEAAIRMAGVPAGEIFFVDDRAENVAGAIAAGIDAVLYTTTPQLVADLRRRGLEFNY
ncbi:MAG: HAD family phosphatase [Pirellulales bacterium]